MDKKHGKNTHSTRQDIALTLMNRTKHTYNTYFSIFYLVEKKYKIFIIVKNALLKINKKIKKYIVEVNNRVFAVLCVFFGEKPSQLNESQIVTSTHIDFDLPCF